MRKLKDRLVQFYEQNEKKVDIGFFLAGVLFDVFTLSEIDDPFSIAQQTVYLLLIGALLYYDFLFKNGFLQISGRLEKAWVYRDLAIHFLLGSLLSVYSLFFLKSSSFFASFVFILLMMGLMVVNEMKSVQKNEINLKIALYLICVFSFFSMIFPVLLGFVGWVPFLMSLGATALFLAGIYQLLLRRVGSAKLLVPALLVPGGTVLSLFFAFYLLGWIPPVPLSVHEMGIYHRIEKQDGQYLVSDENPWWRFWRSGDQEFIAEPGDEVFVFVRIFSPSRFNDSIILHWQYYDPVQGWQTSDRIPMKVSGGREGGYRGFASKKNYSDGEWRVLVETTDGREVGRLKLWITKVPVAYERRIFETTRR